MLAAVADLVLVLLAAPVVLASGYLLVLAALSRRPRPPPYGLPRLRFDVVVPAHDEEAGIAATVRSLLAVDYPPVLRRVIVVADNCRDATATRAREAGAIVLVRDDASRRGKGHALLHAFDRALADGADAVVVVDADTVVSPNLLRAFAARLEAGAPAVQADNVVANVSSSWRTRLMAIALVLFNTVRSLGREMLRCSTGLRGNGMCLSARLLREVRYQAFSIVEDLEYGIRIGLAGHRVHFAHEARVASQMTTSAGAARSQRRRWEGGRAQMAREHGLALVGRGIASRDRILLDLGLDLLVPPLATLAALSAFGSAAALAASWLAGRPLVAAVAWLASLAALCGYVLRGWQLSRTGWRGLQALLRAPLYLLWKLGLAGRSAKGAPDSWVRTEREQGS